MKTLNQEQLFFIAGGQDNHEDNIPSTEGGEVEVPEIEEETGLQSANAFISKMVFGCC